MIRSQDRSGWFGASDTNTIMGNWQTKTFARFWLEKMGLVHGGYVSPAMMAGTYYEHRILDYLGIARRDRQIKIRRYKLRVNLDGETSVIHEVKTHSSQFKLSTAYWRQAQVEMFAARKPLEIVAYRLLPEDYNNYFNEIDPARLSRHPVEYDPVWLENEYLPRLRYLAYCLKRCKTPILAEVDHGKANRQLHL